VASGSFGHSGRGLGLDKCNTTIGYVSAVAWE